MSKVVHRIREVSMSQHWCRIAGTAVFVVVSVFSSSCGDPSAGTPIPPRATTTTTEAPPTTTTTSALPTTTTETPPAPPVATQPPAPKPAVPPVPKPKPVPPKPAPPPPPPSVYYANCDAVRAAGKAPLYRGQPGYRAGLDRDNDGVACEN
jgi:hypothetical protein